MNALARLRRLGPGFERSPEAPASDATLRRNLGPVWGSRFLLWAERRWPRWLFRGALVAGTWIAVAVLPVQRAHSRAYLSVALGRPARLGDVRRHFFVYMELFLRQLRVGGGAPVHCRLDPENEAAFEALVAAGRPALFGTFHFGCSDLLGYLLSERGRRVSILRLRVGNSPDTRLLGERFAAQVAFLWINNPATLFFKLKAAIEAGDSLALKCDRLEFSAKSEPFRFLGAPRRFPFTIYHLALLFDRPVVFCTAVPGATEGELRVFASPVFTPNAAVDRATNLHTARQHFQAVVTTLEDLVRTHPYYWFNFLPLNPEPAPHAQPVRAAPAPARERRPSPEGAPNLGAV